MSKMPALLPWLARRPIAGLLASAGMWAGMMMASVTCAAQAPPPANPPESPAGMVIAPDPPVPPAGGRSPGGKGDIRERSLAYPPARIFIPNTRPHAAPQNSQEKKEQGHTREHD
jgi:hypothetical protein